MKFPYMSRHLQFKLFHPTFATIWEAPATILQVLLDVSGRKYCGICQAVGENPAEEEAERLIRETGLWQPQRYTG